MDRHGKEKDEEEQEEAEAAVMEMQRKQWQVLGDSRNRRWECRSLKFFKNQKPALGVSAIEIF